jgi:gluconokinase
MTGGRAAVSTIDPPDQAKTVGAPVVVMGVSGSGKSTVGAMLATKLGFSFVDGDDLHPIANKQKMAAAIPLTDDDRKPWLDAIADSLRQRDVVVACSALRRIYRDRLRYGLAELSFICLTGSRELLRQRLMSRAHEYMPSVLLDSQLATLELPGVDERALILDINAAPEEVAALAADWLIDRATVRPGVATVRHK